MPQQEFRVMGNLFDWVGLGTNVDNKLSISCQPCCALGRYSMEVYVLHMTGGGVGKYYPCTSDVYSVMQT